MPSIINIKNVNFKNIIQYPHIEIKSEQTSFIIADSGCGKTTLLKLINGIASADSGIIEYNGKDIADMDTIELRKQVVLVSQSVFLFDKTIKENFADFYAYRDLPAPSEQRIREYLLLCCADFALDTPCTTMSGGERHRVYIAICLSFMPKVFMLDEPTSALDSINSNCLLQNLKTFCYEHHITLLVVSHDKRLAENFADDIIALERSVKL